MSVRDGPAVPIGMPSIKRRRLDYPVRCHLGDRVGDYVPFHFCPRSVMLYVIHMGNLPGLEYRGGQGPIVHLEADLHDVVGWARSSGCRWAFSLSNAGAGYAEFRSELSQLHEIDWSAVAATDFRSPDVKERKQAEFLVHGALPWHLVSRVGVHSAKIRTQVEVALVGTASHPPVEIRPEWYY